MPPAPHPPHAQPWRIGVAVLIAVVAGGLLVWPIQVGLLLLRFGDRAPTLQVTQLKAVGFSHGAFYVSIRRTLDKSSEIQYLRSDDGGRTWTGTTDSPEIPTSDALGEDPIACAIDQICYRAGNWAGARQQTQDFARAIEMRRAEGPWMNEATFGSEDPLRGVAVDPADSGQAIVGWQSGGITYRAAAGDWRRIDVTLIADELWASTHPASHQEVSRPGVWNTRLTSSTDEIATARRELGHLTTTEESTADTGYQRAAFGPEASDTDGNGCDQRVDALLRDLDRSRQFTTERRDDCATSPVSGTWHDSYTGSAISVNDLRQLDQAARLGIDRVVPLSAAWRAGAQDWKPERRKKFAGDLNNLVVAGVAIIKAKSSGDASAWRPARAGQCGYAVRYIGVKADYDLSVDVAERAALAGMLTTC